MFIKITTPANPLRIENTLRTYKKGEKPFSPEIAKQILSSTNNPKNIRDTLHLIAALPTTEQAQYKDFVLSAFDHRKQPNDTIILAKKLAVTNNYEEELNQIINHDPMTDTKNGIIYASAANEIAAYIFSQKPNLSELPPNATIYCTNLNIYLSEKDLSMVKTLKFKEDSSVYLSGCTNLPEELDLSGCKKVNLYGDLSAVKTLTFRENSEVDLSDSTNFPEELDVSMCRKVNLSCTDLSAVKTLTFRENSEVYLSGCTNLPEELDLSGCKKVNLSYADLSAVKTLTFRKNSEVDLSGSANLPEELDFSMCNNINLSCTNLSKPQTITFKNKAQQQESKIKIPENWQGKITYSDNINNTVFRFTPANTR